MCLRSGLYLNRGKSTCFLSKVLLSFVITIYWSCAVDHWWPCRRSLSVSVSGACILRFNCTVSDSSRRDCHAFRSFIQGLYLTSSVGLMSVWLEIIQSYVDFQKCWLNAAEGHLLYIRRNLPMNCCNLNLNMLAFHTSLSGVRKFVYTMVKYARFFYNFYTDIVIWREIWWGLQLIARAYPYIAKRLLTDEAEELRGALEEFLIQNGSFRSRKTLPSKC